MPIYAPEAATISVDQGLFPLRVVLTASSGDPYPGLIGFGHVNPVVSSGPVVAGQEIATEAPNGSGGPHVEFMYSPSGGRSYLAFTGCSEPCGTHTPRCWRVPYDPNSAWVV